MQDVRLDLPLPLLFFRDQVEHSAIQLFLYSFISFFIFNLKKISFTMEILSMKIKAHLGDYQKK